MVGRIGGLKIHRRLFKDCLDFLKIAKSEGYSIQKTDIHELRKLCREILGCSHSKATDIVNFLARIYFGLWDY